MTGCLSAQERAPFKLTREMIDVMGGEHSLEFATFRDLVIRGFRASRRVLPKVKMLVGLALEAHGGTFPCFAGGREAVMDGLTERFRTDLVTKRETATFVNEVRSQACAVRRSLTLWVDNLSLRSSFWHQWHLPLSCGPLGLL